MWTIQTSYEVTMRHHSYKIPTWLGYTLLVTVHVFCTVNTQETNESSADITNSSEPNVFDILNDLDIQNVISNMQQDGRLDDIVNTIITGATVSLNIHDECVKDILTMVQGIGNFDMWAIQMLDAIGKPHSGILSDLDFKWYGSFDGCLDVKAITYTNKTLQIDPEHHFNGKYCKIGIPVPAALAGIDPKAAAVAQNIDLGVCIPDSCKTEDMKILMTLVGTYVFNASSTYEPTAACDDGMEIETKTIVAICVLTFLGTVCIIGTLYDIYLRLQTSNDTNNSWKSPEKKRNGGLTCNLKVDMSTVNGEKMNDNIGIENARNGDMIKQETKNTPVTDQSTLEKIFLSFSVYSNGLKILNTNQPKGALTCINGIRFFSMTWVILGHSVTLDAKNSIPYFFNKKFWQWTFYGVYNATVSVDTFFTLSGLLVSYLTLKEITKRGGAKKTNWLMFYLHRFLRLTPAYMLTLMVYATIAQYLGDGPKWPGEMVKQGELCDKSWWTNLLYINNYVQTDQMCMGWSWYLANDMQFYILSPLIIVPLYYNAAVGTAIAGIFLIGTTVARTIISRQHEYTALFLGVIGPRPKDAEVMKNMYFPAYTRMGPYIIGLLAGYLLYRYKDTFKMKRVWTMLGWFLCMSIIVLVVYGVYPDDGKHFLSVNESVAYLTLHRTGWGIAVAWIIFACATGHGGWINDFLSWSPFAPLGRLTYCAYLVHPIVLYTYLLCKRTQLYLTDLEMIYFYIGNVVMSNFVAFGTSLLFEAPMMGLEKLLLKRT